jgi:hypothetical protein
MSPADPKIVKQLQTLTMPGSQANVDKEQDRKIQK